MVLLVPVIAPKSVLTPNSVLAPPLSAVGVRRCAEDFQFVEADVVVDFALRLVDIQLDESPVDWGSERAGECERASVRAGGGQQERTLVEHVQVVIDVGVGPASEQLIPAYI